MKRALWLLISVLLIGAVLLGVVNVDVDVDLLATKQSLYVAFETEQSTHVLHFHDGQTDTWRVLK